MRKVILLLFLVVFIIGCDEIEKPVEKEFSSEEIGDNARIITTEGTYQGRDFEKQDIIYEKDIKGGKKEGNIFIVIIDFFKRLFRK